MALAQVGSTNIGSRGDGGANIGFGSGYYGGVTALGMSVSSFDQANDHAFSLGASITPGGNDIALQSGVRFHVGPHVRPAAQEASRAPHEEGVLAAVRGVGASLQQLLRVEALDVIPSKDIVFARIAGVPYRITFEHMVHVMADGGRWYAKIERLPQDAAADPALYEGGDAVVVAGRQSGNDPSLVLRGALAAASRDAAR